MANRSSFGPMVLVIAAMSCSFYVACGDDDVIFEPTAGTGGVAGRAGTGGGGTGGTSAGTGGTAAGTGGTGGTTAGTGGTGGTTAGTGGTGPVDEPDAGGPDAGDDGGIITPND
jgi:hypothetical protein